jgi:hypothetical protein
LRQRQCEPHGVVGKEFRGTGRDRDRGQDADCGQEGGQEGGQCSGCFGRRTVGALSASSIP